MQETYHMDSKRHIAAAAAGLALIWGAAHAGSEATQGSPAECAPALSAQSPQGVSAAANDAFVLELGPTQGQAGQEEMAAMQMLLLQLLMMQQEMNDGQTDMTPQATVGVEI
jgi:hypothetical protein